jgi:hypothetical protein
MAQGNVIVQARKAERELEWRRAKSDLVFFYQEFWTVETVGTGYAKPIMWDFQVEDLKILQASLADPTRERHLRLKARQIGFTTLTACAFFWRAFFYPNSSALLASVGEDEAKKTLLKRVKRPYRNLPGWMRDKGPKLVTDTTVELGFDNGSSILSIPSTESASRGDAVYAVMMDEAAFVGTSEDVFAALDPLCYGPLWMVSTANGIGNFFHEAWIDSSEPDSEWQSSFRAWHVREDRDQEWYERQKRLYRKRPHLFFQEYPSTPEEAFSKSGNTVFEMAALRAFEDWTEPAEYFDLQLIREGWYTMVADFDAFLANHLTNSDNRSEAVLHVWQRPYVLRDEHGRPVQRPNFVVSVDTAEGLDGGDYTAISVLDLNTGEYVATLLGHPPLENIGPLSEFIAYWYYTALLMVERNNTGIAPLEYLFNRATYPRLYRRAPVASIDKQGRSNQFGWHTSRPSKTKMVVDFQAAIANESIILHDLRFLSEAQSFIHDGKGGFGAAGTTHDDMVLSHMIAFQGYMEQGAYPIQWIDDVHGPPTMGDIVGTLMEYQGGTQPFRDAAFTPIAS